MGGKSAKFGQVVEHVGGTWLGRGEHLFNYGVFEHLAITLGYDQNCQWRTIATKKQVDNNTVVILRDGPLLPSPPSLNSSDTDSGRTSPASSSSLHSSPAVLKSPLQTGGFPVQLHCCLPRNDFWGFELFSGPFFNMPPYLGL